MVEKGRFEIIIDNIIYGGGYKSIRSAWALARSESARLEAEMIDLASQTQNNIIAYIGKLRPRQLENYSTNKTKEKISKALGVMVGDYETLARQMVVSNLIAGKLKANANSRLSGDELISVISLNEKDQTIVERMVSDLVSKVKKGASLTMSSVGIMLQNASIQSNQNMSNGNDMSVVTTQTPVSNGFVPEDIDIRITRKLIPKLPSKKELEEIKNNPVLFARKTSKQNVGVVSRLHSEYLGSIQSNKEQAKSLSEESSKSAKQSKAVKQELENNLLSNGLSAFTDVSGKKWSLVTYCAMSARGISSRSTNFGEVFADESHDLYYLVPHGGACPICARYEGKVYSRSGKNPNYPPLSSVFRKIDPNGSDDLSNSYLTIHPNCRHKLVRYFEENKKKS